MDVAILFEKYDLDVDKCCFKPITVIRGEYNKKAKTFISESGLVCDDIKGGYSDGQSYFGYPTTEEELKKTYGEYVSNEILFSNFFDISLGNCYLGIYNENETIDLVVLPIYEMKDKTINNSNDPVIPFNLEALNVLRSCKTVEEFQKEIDSVIELINRIKNNKSYNDLSGNEDLKLEDNEEEIEEKSDEKAVEIKEVLPKKKEEQIISLTKLRKVVKSQIIAQDKAVDNLTTALVVNYTSKNPRHKSHIMITGPSGTGKTEMVKIISDYLGVPCFKADATSYTKEGYVGKSVQSMLTGLLNAAGGDIEKAQNGILVIDEIDKKASSRDDDISGKDVLYSLLKIMDRTQIEVNTEYYKSYMFDTSNLTIICMGAFERLYEQKTKSLKRQIGFSLEDTNASCDEIILTNEDFIKYGMPAEFMGRIGRITSTKKFTVEDLVEILYKSKISPIKEEKEWFKDRKVKLYASHGFCEIVAMQSLKSGTGARDLKRLVSEKVSCATDYVLTHSKVKAIRLTKQTALDPKKFCVQ
jgi:ATP-dependent Clp protease ATP-binding subunit ClpX